MSSGTSSLSSQPSATFVHKVLRGLCIFGGDFHARFNNWNNKKTMKTKTVKKIMCASVVGLTLCLARSASAQDSHWNGTPGDNVWNDPNNWNPVGVPPSGGPDFIGNVWLDQANGDTLFVIPPGDVESPGVPPPGSTEEFNTIFGPEFGASLDIYGTLNFDWLLFPVQNNPAPAVRTHVNLYNNSIVNCVGASGTGGAALGIGDSWFYQDAPYETMNLYGNAQYNSLGGAGLWLGGHLNIYDTASFYVNGYVNMDVLFDQSDGTRSIVLGGGTLTLPEGTMAGTGPNSGSVDDWIGRGILRAYGKGEDTNDLNISDNGTNTIVTPVPLGGALQRVYFKPLLQTTVNVGAFQQATLVGDYPSVSGVLLSSSEPGLSPGSFTHPVYTSSNPGAATIDTNGVVTAVGIGTTTLSATVGAFTSTNSVVLTVAPVVPGIAHEYKFATDASDSIGGADGSLNGDATISGGQLVLSGNQGSSVSLPSGILTGVNVVTIEAWVTFPSAINAFANLFAFGNSELAGNGENYITLSPHTGGLTTQANFGQGDPGSSGEWDAVAGGVLDNETNVQVVAVFNPYAGSESVYINGALAANNSMFNNLLDPVACQGPTYNNASILAYTLGGDPINYIGQSLYSGDPGLLANIDEFRIYTNALTAAQIAADHALGPNQFIGTSTNVTLSASLTGDPSIVINWPTTSALVNLVSSPALGAGAVWTPVNTSSLVVVGGNYQITIPVAGSALFFRLQQ
jgi:Concanavalin A-like lectin/glucanases superfamily